jgi:hypothetical protein
MHRMLFLLALLGFALPAVAVEDTWLNSSDPENSSYLTPKLKVSTLNDEPILWPGLGFGWVIGSVFAVGFEGYMLSSEIHPEIASDSQFNMAVGGMTFEAIAFPERRTHLAFDVLIGAGGAQAEGALDFDSLRTHNFFILEPGVNIEFNLTRNVRLSPGVSYLWISGDVAGMPSKQRVSEMAFNLKLKFKKPDEG